MSYSKCKFYVLNHTKFGSKPGFRINAWADLIEGDERVLETAVLPREGSAEILPVDWHEKLDLLEASEIGTASGQDGKGARGIIRLQEFDPPVTFEGQFEYHYPIDGSPSTLAQSTKQGETYKLTVKMHQSAPGAEAIWLAVIDLKY